ncbi:UNVERIFIED_CONTAM: hypothetical protein FKN15_063837 [Acipenser sinensis]
MDKQVASPLLQASIRHFNHDRRLFGSALPVPTADITTCNWASAALNGPQQAPVVRNQVQPPHMQLPGDPKRLYCSPQPRQRRPCPHQSSLQSTTCFSVLYYYSSRTERIQRVIAGSGRLAGWKGGAEPEGARHPEAERQGSSRQGSGAGGSTAPRGRTTGLFLAGQRSRREHGTPRQNDRALPGRAAEPERTRHPEAERQGSSRQGSGAGGSTTPRGRMTGLFQAGQRSRRTAPRGRTTGLFQAGQRSRREHSTPRQNDRALPGRLAEPEGARHPEAERQGSSRQGSGARGSTAPRGRTTGLFQAGQRSRREHGTPRQNDRALPGRAAELEEGSQNGSSRQGSGAGGSTAPRGRTTGLFQAGQRSRREHSTPRQNDRALPGRAAEPEGAQHPEAERQGSSRQGSGAGGSTAPRGRTTGLFQAGQRSRREHSTPRQNDRALPGRAAEPEGAQHPEAERQGSSRQGSGAGGSTAPRGRTTGLFQAGQRSRREHSTPRQNDRALPGRAAEPEGAQHPEAERQGSSRQGSGAGGSTAPRGRTTGLFQAGQRSRREHSTPRQNDRALPGRAAEPEGAQHPEAERQGSSRQGSGAGGSTAPRGRTTGLFQAGQRSRREHGTPRQKGSVSPASGRWQRCTEPLTLTDGCSIEGEGARGRPNRSQHAITALVDAWKRTECLHRVVAG